MRFNKKLGLVFLLALFALIVSACGGDEEEQTEEPPGASTIQFQDLDTNELTEDVVVATYEGGEVKGDQFATYLGFQGFINPYAPINDPDFRKELIKVFIIEQLIHQETDEEGEAQTKADEAWEELTVAYGEEASEEGLVKLGLTEDELRQSLRDYFVVEEYFFRQVTEQEVEDFYGTIQAEITTANVRHLLINTHERQEDGSMVEVRSDEEAKPIIDDLYQQLMDGEDFGELASQHSEDPGSKESGGLYENAPVANYTANFKEAVMEQEINEIGEPVKTEFGYHIIRVEERNTLSLDEVREELIYQLSNQKFTQYYTEAQDKIQEIHI